MTHAQTDRARKSYEAAVGRASQGDRAVVDNEEGRAEAARPPTGREYHVSMANHLREKVESYLGSHKQEIVRLKAQLAEVARDEGADDPAVAGILTLIEGHLNAAD